MERPAGFEPIYAVAGTFVLCEETGDVLLLKRGAGKPQAGTWGAPGGKVALGETVSGANARELQEETGIRVLLESYWGSVFVRYPDTDRVPGYEFIYHMFSTVVPQEAQIMLNAAEHSGYGWFSMRRALLLPLIPDMAECIRMFLPKMHARHGFGVRAVT